MGTTDARTTSRIAALNDRCRAVPGLTGRLVITQGIQALPTPALQQILTDVQRFDAFTPGDDPYGERDFGAFDHHGERILWKIDYYDPTLTCHSDDPSDPSKTVRVLTIMLASEY